MNIQPITSQASKAEEIAILNKVAQVFQPGTYIHDLFTERFLSWVETQLKNDFPPDVFMVIDQLAEDSANANKHTTGALTALEMEERAHKRTKEQAERAKEQAQAEYQDIASRFREMADQKLDAYAKCNEYAFELGNAETLIAKQTAEIQALKVKLYDLQNA